MKVSDNFSIQEISCRCGCGQAIVDKNLYSILESFRSFIGDKRIIVHCVNRCKEHNKKIGGVSTSKHINGSACDCHVNGMSISELHDIAKKAIEKNILCGGVGFYSWGIHIDSGKKRTWKG